MAEVKIPLWSFFKSTQYRLNNLRNMISKGTSRAELQQAIKLASEALENICNKLNRAQLDIQNEIRDSYGLSISITQMSEIRRKYPLAFINVVLSKKFYKRDFEESFTPCDDNEAISQLAKWGISVKNR